MERSRYLVMTEDKPTRAECTFRQADRHLC